MVRCGLQHAEIFQKCQKKCVLVCAKNANSGTTTLVLVFLPELLR